MLFIMLLFIVNLVMLAILVQEVYYHGIAKVYLILEFILEELIVQEIST